MKTAKEQLTPLLNKLRTTVLSTPDRIPETNSISEQSMLKSMVDINAEEITNKKMGAFMERLVQIDELSIANKKDLWQEVHKLYETCDLHKGDLYFSEAHLMI